MKGIVSSLLILLSLVNGGVTLTCLHCDNIFQPRHCRTVIACKDNELCGTELVSDKHGSHLYNVGCFPKANCDLSVSSPNTCLQCCNSDLCNVNLCNQPDYPINRGPICYNCPVYGQNNMCKDIDFCTQDEMCSVRAQLEFSDTVYKSSCVTKTECADRNSLTPAIIGKRSIYAYRRAHEEKVCDVCCNSDICNQDCDSAMADLNGCQSTPCVNNGSCENHGQTFTCHCDIGYTGTNCQTDECSLNPCVHGTCIDHVGYFMCQCNSGYTGPLCLTDIDECSSSPCVHGTCIDHVGTFSCLCDMGYTGQLCDTGVDTGCLSIPCTNNGTCESHMGTYTCHCESGFTGQQCETDIDECSSSPCVHATCIDHVGTFSCQCDMGYTGQLCDTVMSDCVDVLSYGGSTNGVYGIILNGTHEQISVYCDMTTHGGGWTVFQYRYDGSVNFYRNFSEYEKGFGNVSGEFWLGLQTIRELSKSIPTVLRLDLVAGDNRAGYELFQDFALSSRPRYVLNIGTASGPIGESDGLTFHNHQPFSTFDQDVSAGHCVSKYRGGWWYDNCFKANLNAIYKTPGSDCGNTGYKCMTYKGFDQYRSLRSSKMMIRRKV